VFEKSSMKKAVQVKDILKLPVAPPPGSDDSSYPSQNPSLLGTSTRSFVNKQI
jgi:hypothetical protein